MLFRSGDSFWLLARILPSPGTAPDSTIFLCSQIFDSFLVLVGNVFGYSDGLYHFTVLARILPFFGTLIDSTLFRYSWGQLLVTRTNSTFYLYSPGFYHFSVFPQIRPLSGTRRECFFILARILPFPGTRPDSTFSQIGRASCRERV